jgi:hypothetical protein
MLTTTVLAFGADMLTIACGKNPGANGAQFDGETLTPAWIISNVNSRSFELSVWPLDHLQGFSVIDIVLSPFDQTGAFATLNAVSTVGVEPCGA